MSEQHPSIALAVTLKKGVPPTGMPTAVVPTMSRELLDFKGDEGNPFLAPRGVCMAGGRLLVSDTGQNRVFIWNNIPTTMYAAPDVVLGQLTATDTERNAGQAVAASSLLYPSGLWSDGNKLVVADAWNHRVLIWHSMPKGHGQPADVVVGQPDMSSNQPNVQGVGSPPTARSLYWPYGVSVHEGRLFIADTGNRRVLVYDQLPDSHYAAADFVIGKPDMNTRDYESEDAVWPYSVKLGPEGQLAITDTQYYRVLLWHHWRDALLYKAAAVVGQPNTEESGQNQFGLFPAAHTLSWCYDSAFYNNGLLVADTGNSRILWFQRIPESNNAAADGLIGRPDFHTGSEHAATILGTEQAMYWPFSISPNPSQALLAIADTGNHRILLHLLDTPSASSASSASSDGDFSTT
jgi:hypothetical protein